MTDYTMDSDELRRIHALEEALRPVIGDEVSTEEILSRAEKFERYLKDGAGEPAVRGVEVESEDRVIVVDESPKSPALNADLLPLPIPKHTDFSTPENPCLGCEWIDLRRKIKECGDE